MMATLTQENPALERKRQQIQAKIDWLNQLYEAAKNDPTRQADMKYWLIYQRAHRLNVSALEAKLEALHECPCCGCILTDPCSINNGIGPECSKPKHLAWFPCNRRRKVGVPVQRS